MKFHLLRILGRLIFPVLLVGILSACAPGEILYYAAPSLLPETERQMKTAGFWVGRHPFPDRLILTAGEISALNDMITDDLELTSDITLLPDPFAGDDLLKSLEEDLNRYTGRKLFMRDGGCAPSSFFATVQKNMKKAGVPPEIPVRYGLVVRYAGQRALPTEDPLYAKPMDIDFDELRNNSLDVGTSVAVIHESADGKWLYVFDEMHRGWMEKEAIAFCTREQLAEYTDSPGFVVVTAPKGAIYLNRELTEYFDYARMGTRLPLAGEPGADTVGVVVPARNSDGTVSFKAAAMGASEVHVGYLPYTPRTIIRQAFLMLNQPYGWGGMYGEQDCSRFIDELFATVGILLPRNSTKQAQVGRLIAEYMEDAPGNDGGETLCREGMGGITIIQLKGHVMLFLGCVNGRPYAIHDTWGYRERIWSGDRIRLINRVAVTDLSLGKGTKKGSYLDRLITVRVLAH
jgi:hypothetical protein